MVRIGEIDDSIGREFTSRREAMASELRNLGTKLAEPVPGATAPAVALSDSVHISPEARAAGMPHLARRLPLGPFPSPAELVAALGEIATAPLGAAPSAAVERLAALVRELASSIPRVPTGIVPGPAETAAAAIIREILVPSNPSAAAPGRNETLARLVRELLAALPSLASPAAGALRPLPAERAAIAILVAIMAGEGAPSQAQATIRPDTTFPPALLSLLIDTRRPVRGAKRKSASGRAEPARSDEEEAEGEEPAFDRPMPGSV